MEHILNWNFNTHFVPFVIDWADSPQNTNNALLGSTSANFERFLHVGSLNDNQKQPSRSCVAKGLFVERKDLLDAQPKTSL
jgi:hypothetical protein